MRSMVGKHDWICMRMTGICCYAMEVSVGVLKDALRPSIGNVLIKNVRTSNRGHLKKISLSTVYVVT